MRDHDQAGKAYTLLSVLSRAEGNLAEAERCARRATVSYRQSRNVAGQIAAHDALGEALQARGRPAEAAEAWATALTIAEDVASPLAPMLRQRLNQTDSIEQDARTTPLGSPS
jgi:tetratricopeptide (TPR) repeat protein